MYVIGENVTLEWREVLAPSCKNRFQTGFPHDEICTSISKGYGEFRREYKKDNRTIIEVESSPSARPRYVSLTNVNIQYCSVCLK